MKVDAGPCARRYRLVDGRPRTEAVVVGGHAVGVDGPEVTLRVDGRRLSDADLRPSAIEEAPDGTRLAWSLTGDGLTVRMVVEADRAAGVVRKRAEVTGRGRLTCVELERWPGVAVDGPGTTGEPVAYNTGPVGLGQPLFGPGFFAGIEHPVAENLAGGGATCSLPVAVDLGPEPYVSPSTVVGAGGMEAFWDYVDTLRPVPPRLVTLTNNWYHLGAPGLMDEAAVRAEVDGFAAVESRHGLTLDFVALDDGWEGDWAPATGLWGRMAPAAFPRGLAGLGPRIGLWLSAFGGYGDRRRRRLAWAADHGFEIDGHAGLLCAAATRYREHLADSLTGWTAAGIGYWKLDGLSFACQEPDHGHPVGPGARTAQVDAFRALVEGIRAVRRDAVVAFTIGSHPSPWWLSTVDFVWRGGLDDTEAGHPGSRLDRFDTYVDACLQAFRPSAMPVSALVVFSVVETPAAGYREGSGPDGWARHCWLAVGRGTLHHDLYVAPDSLSDDEWAVLAEALAWGRRQERVLARSRMVLGDPAAGEVYGFAARYGDRAVACLRNPSAERRPLDLDWPVLLGWPAGTPLELITRFGTPAGPGQVLGPFDVVVVEARPLTGLSTPPQATAITSPASPPTPSLPSAPTAAPDRPRTRPRMAAPPAATRLSAPPMASPDRGPHASEIQPRSGPPTGVLPRKTSP